MTDRILKWGLLSTARINRAIIPPLGELARHEVTAVASRSGERARAFAARWDIPRAHAGYEALLADPDVDVVYVPLPNSLHAEWTIKAARAGKHVLCEKPLALTPGEVDRIGEAADRHGVVVSEAFMYRHHPQTLEARRLIVEERALGDIVLLHGTFTFRLADRDNIRFDPGLGGGALWDVGCYPVSWMRFLLGADPEEVFGWARLSAEGVDEALSAQLRFASGVIGSLDCAFIAPYRASLEVIGSEGSLSLPRPYKPGERSEIVLTRQDASERLVFPGQMPYAGEIEDMADAVLLGTPPTIPLAESRGNVRTLKAILHSARVGRPVQPAGMPDDEV